MISTSFLISLNAQTEAGEDTLKIPQGQQIKPALDAITQDRQNSTALDPLDLEIDEIILDETITKVGRDFYDLFYNDWNNPTQIKNFSITIKEMPMPGIGTQITVMIDDFEILKQFIRPNQEMIELLSAYTVDLATQFLLNYEEIQAQLQNEDQAGTGIY